jgi:hypothetical protein
VEQIIDLIVGQPEDRLPDPNAPLRREDAAGLTAPPAGAKDQGGGPGRKS